MTNKVSEIMELLKSNNVVVVVGSCRSGKTTLLKTLLKTMNARYLNLQECENETDFFMMLNDSLNLELEASLEASINEIQKQSLVFLIDEFLKMEQLDTTGKIQRWLQKLSQKYCKLVLASQQSLSVSAFSKKFIEVRLP